MCETTFQRRAIRVSARRAYKFVPTPPERELVDRIDKAAMKLGDKLVELDVAKLSISDYSKKYLQDKVKNLSATLQLYSYILGWAMAGTGAATRPVIFLEYGGGLGILSLLAKESDIGIVVYNDIYDVSCSDAKTLAKRLEAAADHYVTGDIDDVLLFLSRKNMRCDAVGSYDVIEHIYDIRDFFDKLPGVSNGRLTLAMASGANSMNPVIRLRLMKQQREVENQNRDRPCGHKERDSLRAYRTIRAEIVHQHSRIRGAHLSPDEIMELAVNSRGLIASDIRLAVDTYLLRGELPEPPAQATDTCDPITGNWAEHLLNPTDLARLLSEKGFAAVVMSGYFGRSARPLIRSLTTTANLVIRALPSPLKLFMAPFYMICGERIRPIGTRSANESRNFT